MNVNYDPKVRWVPLKQIDVLNAHDWSKKKFGQIVGIARLGLKRPVTLCRAGVRDGEPRYDLVCGQGRLEAFASLGQEMIPAIVVEGTKEELLLMSLAENLARRQYSTVELMSEIRSMKERGNTLSQIARKIDLDTGYVRGILLLLDQGEERQIRAVEAEQLPLSIAITIATADDKAVQRALQEAYEKHDLRGKGLLRAQRLIESRRAKGKGQRHGPRNPTPTPVSSHTLLKTFQEETLRQKLIIQKAKICETRLLFAVSALKQLFQDDHFLTLLRAEGLDSLPEYLGGQIYNRGGAR